MVKLAVSSWPESTNALSSDGFKVDLLPRPGTLRFLPSALLDGSFPMRRLQDDVTVEEAYGRIGISFRFKDITGTTLKMQPYTKDGVYVEAYKTAAI